jgi:hypothetical protein
VTALSAEVDGWLRIDEREDAIISFEHCAKAISLVSREPANWKWCLLSGHNGAQGALVCTLSGTAGIGAYERRSQREWLAYFESSRGNRQPQPPKIRLADFMELVRRARHPEPMAEFGSGPIELTDAEFKDLQLLNSLRRGLTHFDPCGWSIEIAGLPRIISAAAKVGRICLLGHPTNVLRLEPDQRVRISAALEDIDREARTLAKADTA